MGFKYINTSKIGEPDGYRMFKIDEDHYIISSDDVSSLSLGQIKVLPIALKKIAFVGIATIKAVEIRKKSKLENISKNILDKGI